MCTCFIKLDFHTTVASSNRCSVDLPWVLYRRTFNFYRARYNFAIFLSILHCRTVKKTSACLHSVDEFSANLLVKHASQSINQMDIDNIPISWHVSRND